MNPSIHHAAWTLATAFGMSLVYEFYRATAKAGVSRHDSMRVFVREGIPLYVAAAVIVGVMFAGFAWAAWLGLVFAGAAILVSIFYYNPRVMMERRPGVVDWVEDLVFTGLLFVAATQLVYVLWQGA